MPTIPELLENLLTAPSPSGYEGPATAVWREAAGFANHRELEAAEHHPAVRPGVANHLQHRADNIDARSLEFDD